MEDLNELAVRAKTDDQAFTELVQRLRGLINSAGSRYFTGDREEVKQWARIEIWNAVKLFQPDKGKSFFGFCRMTVFNHIASRLRRIYGKANEPNRLAARLDEPVTNGQGGEGDAAYLEAEIKNKDPLIPDYLVRKENLDNIHRIIQNAAFTPLEYNCMVLFYFEECSHKEIQKRLNLPSRKSVDNSLARVRRKLAASDELRLITHELLSG